MPITPQDPIVVCDGCRKQLPEAVFSDLPEGDEDTGLPPGWVHVLNRKKVPNPDFLRAWNTIEEVISAQMAQVPDEDKAEAAPLVREAVEAQTSIEEPEWLMVAVVGCYCTDCGDAPQMRGGMDDWPEVE